MRSVEARESAPTSLVVDVHALRPNADDAAEDWRRSLPMLMAGLVGEVSGAELTLGLHSDADGMVAIQMGVSAGARTAELAAELSALLAPVAETGIRAGVPDHGAEWPLVACLPLVQLGFAAGVSDHGPAAVPQRIGDEFHVGELIEELAILPGYGLRARLRATDRGIAPRWEVQFHVITDGSDPALRLKAALRRRLPGLRTADREDREPAWLQVGPGDLPTVFGFPVAGSEPMAGTYVGTPAPILVVPRRDTGNDGDAGIRLGYAMTGGGRPVAVSLTESERLRHVHVVGQTGTGKSSAMAAMAYAVADRGEGALVVDPHGSLCDRILAELPEEARERAWVIRCGDVQNPVPINPLAEADPARREIAIADICGTFQYLFDKKESGIVGPRFTERVAMTLRALAAVHGTRASLLDVPLASSDDGFMAAAVAASGDDRLKVWWKTNAMEKSSAEHGQVLAWVNSKFESFANTAAMRGILGSGTNAVDFVDAMDDGRIILLDLSKSELGEQPSRLLGFLYLSRVWEAALRRTRRDIPFTVLVDEAHTLISGALTNMLAEGRKFGLSVVLAHQYLDQLDEELRPATAGNVATTVAFRSAVTDAVELRRRFGGRVEESSLVTLPDLTAITLRTAAGGAAYPHSLMIDHNERVSARNGDDLVAHTEALMSQTCADLVDPHRDLTVAAAAGTFNIKSIEVERLALPAAARRPSRTKPPTPAPGAAAPGGSFLDEWLAKRARLADQQESAPTDDGPDESQGIGAVGA